MAVTTREYSTSTSRPKDVLQLLHDAITDLGWFEPQPMGYLCNFTNTPGSTLVNQANARYLVTATTTTASSGTGAVFDVFRTPVGAISAVTLVTGGEGYYIRGQNSAASVGTLVNLPDTIGINPGMVVTKLAGGTGALQSNTLVVSVNSATQITIDQTPSTPLANATLSFSDTLTIGAESIGGATYSIATTGISGQTTVTVTTATNVFIGQRVIGTGIGPLAVVTAITSSTVTLSKANTGTVSGNVIFSDEITVTATGTANIENISGTASGLTITNVANNANIYVGGTIELQSGTPTWDPSNGRVVVASITGTGPYTITLRNEENTFKGFTSSGPITFSVASGTNINWFEIDTVTAPQTYVWGVAKFRNAPTGKLRDTFWLVYIGYTSFPYGIFIGVRALTGFNPLTNSVQGVGGLDFIVASGSTVATYAANFQLATVVASSVYVPLKLKTRQSALDTNFSTFAFYEANGNNNRNPFFIPKYNNPAAQPWSYEDVFLTGATEIVNNAAVDVNDAGILFRTRVGAARRMAESGYSSYVTALTSGPLFRSLSGNRSLVVAAGYAQYSFYTRQLGDLHTSVGTTYPVYKNIAVNPTFFPVPYYLPEDFVMIELPWLNPAIGDTITVSPSEIYTIIQLATNQITYSSLAFAARTT